MGSLILVVVGYLAGACTTLCCIKSVPSSTEKKRLARLLGFARESNGIQMMSVKWEGGKETRRRWTWFPLIALATAMLPESAEACTRCGRSPCRFVAHHAVAAPVVQHVVQQTPDVYVIQNNNPAPLVAQGSVGYTSTGPQGFQAATIPLLDPNQYFSQELQLLRAASDANALRSERSAALFQRVAELNAPVAERLAAGQAASMVLQAAGLDPSNKPAALQSSAVVIRRDGAGGVQVQPLTQTQVESLTVRTTAQNVTTPEAPLPSLGGKFPMLSQHCAKCHGTDLAAPKGGFFLGDDDNVSKTMKERFFDIVEAIDSKSMPPADSPQPTDEERAAILNEIQSIIKTRRGSR